VSATTALVELVRDALRDPSIRHEIKAIVADDEDELATAAPEDEPPIDAYAPGKRLGMSAAAVRAALFRGTLPLDAHRPPASTRPSEH
jgi:hypothetical protein